MSRDRAITDVHDGDAPVKFRHLEPVGRQLSAVKAIQRKRELWWNTLWGEGKKNGRIGELFASRDRSGSRIGELESENKALRDRVLKLEESAKDQGRRLGKVEQLALKAMLAVAALVPTVNWLMNRFGG